ncbi:MAG: hypothetical protein CR997_11390 [Acidobacteria bacterium]|nr:MAG: hypothetical protein CR997_11390 [Acidobacteriota bacterium]
MTLKSSTMLSHTHQTKDAASSQEQSWLEAASNGDVEAFNRLYEKYSGTVFSLCMHFCSSREDAEEVCQEIFITIYKNLKQFRGRASFSTWAYRITVNTLNSRFRKKKIQTESLQPDWVQSSGNSAHLNLLLTEIIKDLPHKMRVVFVLHDRMGFSHEEISQITGYKTGTSRSHLCRARMQLREKLTKVRGGSESV